MQCQIRRFLTTLLLIGTVLLGQPWAPMASAQETDTDVPIVAAGGAVHADMFTGQATTTIPIAVSPWRNGLQPNLAILYGSAHGNGWLGMGWKLEKGVIERHLKFRLSRNSACAWRLWTWR